jgi:hypothetical protein
LTIPFTVPLTEPTGSRTWSATISGTGISDVVQTFGLTVNPPPPPATVDVDLNTMPHNGNLVPFGTHTLNLAVSGTQRGSMQIATVTTTGNHFWSQSMPAGLRVGSGNGNGFRMLLNTAQVDGSPYSVVGVGYCLLNGTGIGAGTPVVVNVLNALDAVIQTQSVSSLPNSNAGPLCQWTTIPAGGTKLEILAPVGAGRFIDSGSWQLWTLTP